MRIKFIQPSAMMLHIHRLYITFYLRSKNWFWGRSAAPCGCFIYDLGPIGIEYIPKGGECDRADKEEI